MSTYFNHSEDLPQQLSQRHRWFWVRVATLVPVAFLYRIALPTWAKWVYLAVLGLSVGTNLIVLYIIRADGRWTWSPKSVFPTYAALARVITAALLVVPFSGEVYKSTRFLPVTYLLYTALLCSLYDLPFYHISRFRKIRLFIDFVMAIASFIVFQGFVNIAWLMFLIPLTTLCRYYSHRRAALIATACWAFIVGWSIIAEPYDYATFVYTALQFAFSPNDATHTFTGFLATSANMHMWLRIKDFCTVGTVFFLVWMIYYEEGRVRFGSIFRFAHMLDMAIRNMTVGRRADTEDAHGGRGTGDHADRSTILN